MEIETRYVLLWTLAELGDRPNGKTFLQKLCFFVGRVLDLDLGFRAHYYGPYSDQLSAELAYLKNNGYVDESRKSAGASDLWGWEVARFDYRLTADGRAAVQWLVKNHPQEAERVREAVRKVLKAGDLSYVALSLAAKTFWVLANEGWPMTFEGIASKARQFRWSVNEDDVRKASDFLHRLDLASVVDVSRP